MFTLLASNSVQIFIEPFTSPQTGHRLLANLYKIMFILINTTSKTYSDVSELFIYLFQIKIHYLKTPQQQKLQKKCIKIFLLLNLKVSTIIP